MSEAHKTSPLLLLIVAAVASLAAEAKADDAPKADKPAADSMLGKEAGQVRDDNGLKMKLVWCPPGAFIMGDNNEFPVRVMLTRGYWLGKYEVTQGEWKKVMATTPWKRDGMWWNGDGITKEGDEFPATGVNWHDAMEYCRNLTERERQARRLPALWEYTLPTEAQWERACRAKTETRFSFGNDDAKLGEYAWFCDNAYKEDYPHQVGQKKPNLWGLHDMHGNVFEWCRDRYSVMLPGGRDPIVTGLDTRHVVRGGCWFNNAPHCSVAVRDGCQSSYKFCYHGFRVALTFIEPAKQQP